MERIVLGLIFLSLTIPAWGGSRSLKKWLRANCQNCEEFQADPRVPKSIILIVQGKKIQADVLAMNHDGVSMRNIKVVVSENPLVLENMHTAQGVSRVALTSSLCQEGFGKEFYAKNQSLSSDMSLGFKTRVNGPFTSYTPLYYNLDGISCEAQPTDFIDHVVDRILGINDSDRSAGKEIPGSTTVAPARSAPAGGR